MTIAVGERVPEAGFKTKTPDGVKTVTTEELFTGRTVVLFGVPGAFTPTCSADHVPGFIDNRDAFARKGVDAVAVVSVNDHHVMGAWETFTGAQGRILFLADGNGTFVKALGLDMDMSGGGMGVRSRRFSMLVRNGVVQALNVEDSPGKAEASGAARLLEQIDG